MPDLSHTFGADLWITDTGDLALSDGPALGLERVLRRLLTAEGEYIWHQEYGAGLPAAVGRVANGPRIAAVIRGQMMQEAAVARDPPPSITVSVGTDGIVTANVSYADAETGATQTLTLPVI